MELLTGVRRPPPRNQVSTLHHVQKVNRPITAGGACRGNPLGVNITIRRKAELTIGGGYIKRGTRLIRYILIVNAKCGACITPILLTHGVAEGAHRAGSLLDEKTLERNEHHPGTSIIQFTGKAGKMGGAAGSLAASFICYGEMVFGIAHLHLNGLYFISRICEVYINLIV
jgi:hypothetical protein